MKRFRKTNKKTVSKTKEFLGFTLIELLIVIAIILILIAIALPNFLEAQIRSRVVKVKGELRSIATAMEAYFLDFGYYPSEHERNQITRNNRGLFWLTSPIAYIQEIPVDPFVGLDPEREGTTLVTYESGGLEVGGGLFLGERCPNCMVTWMLFSFGPDNMQHIHASEPTYDQGRDVKNYSATNGTKSRGSIYYWGGDGNWIGVRAGNTLNKSLLKNPANQIGLTIDDVTYLHRLPHF